MNYFIFVIQLQKGLNVYQFKNPLQSCNIYSKKYLEMYTLHILPIVFFSSIACNITFFSYF